MGNIPHPITWPAVGWIVQSLNQVDPIWSTVALDGFEIAADCSSEILQICAGLRAASVLRAEHDTSPTDVHLTVPRGSLGTSVGFNDAQLPADWSDASISARLHGSFVGGSVTNVAAKRLVLCPAAVAKLEVDTSAFIHILQINAITFGKESFSPACLL